MNLLKINSDQIIINIYKKIKQNNKHKFNVFSNLIIKWVINKELRFTNLLIDRWNKHLLLMKVKFLLPKIVEYYKFLNAIA